ncbi:putative late blight resistance protein homolog R1B-17 [Solanum tuberosum]|uniref:putative late blight resistance protein homolog R1B-17 n=1 Tax=Solanum tuberosum TaxID=4113 RepID=UPI00073A4BFB|nr:PREDICTED: putative late blight resistance protein homolog R1B-17 [Solanum tuberosum]
MLEEREEEEANDSSVSFSALLKDGANVLDFMERLKNEEDQKAVGVDLIEKLTFICTYVQLSYSDLEQFENIMTRKIQEVENLLQQILDDDGKDVGCKYVLTSLAGNMDDCISLYHRSKSDAPMMDKQLDLLLFNLYHLSKHRAEKMFPRVPQYEVLQNVCGNIRDFHRLIVNGCIKHEMVENVLPLFQLMAERVGHFLWEDQTDENAQLSKRDENGRDSRLFKLAHLLLNIVPTELEDFIHHDKLFDLLAYVGALIKEVSTLVHDLEEKLRNKESTDETNRATLKLLENIELLKEDLKHVYLKVPDSSHRCFPISDGPLFMHLLQRHLDYLLDSNAYSIALIKEEIGLVKQDLESIRYFFVNIEQEWYKDIWARVLNVAYEAKNVIDSIIVRDNGLLHLIFSLPITINKINLIKEEVSDLHEKIPKNMSLIVVNTPRPVESKSLTTDKIIVGFEEETNLILRKLTSGPADLDVISITGMPGSGKTTLAYNVYNNKSVSSHFDLRAWCTLDQGYDEKKLLDKIFNQVSDSDSKLSENIDVADKLRKQLFDC